MNAKDRDELMIRLDERSRNTWKTIEQIEVHMATQNGLILENVKSTQRNTVWRKAIVGIVGIGTVIVGWFVKGEIG